MAERPTTGELYKAKAILEYDLIAAVDAYMADRTTGEFALGNAYTLNLAVAVQASDFAMRILGDSAFTDVSKRSAVRTAILLARPVQG